MSAVVAAVDGFSLLNRWLLYTSFMLAPAQFVSGLGNNCPSNIGFLAYNWYTQVKWYNAAKSQEMHAVSLVLVHVNMLFSFTYLAGVSSGNIFMGLFLGLGSAGVIVLNTVAAWTAWATNMREGYGEFQFFFFGWRKLSKGWHTFILLWQISDSLFAFVCFMTALSIPFVIRNKDKDREYPWWLRYPAIPLGAAAMLLIGWPLILWTELIVQRNNIESETDWVAVWLFIVQVGTLLAPSCTATLGCFGMGRKSEQEDVSPPPAERPKTRSLWRLWRSGNKERRDFGLR
ncbi:hypothetical protein ACO1O0_001630 [Amphichorda felina]